MITKTKPYVVGVYGPVVVVEGFDVVSLYEVVRVGELGLLGEVIKIDENRAYVQVYEDTTNIGPGQGVIFTGKTLSIKLGPGLLGSVLDGIGRPLGIVGAEFLERGFFMPTLSETKRWRFKPLVAVGDRLSAGDVVGVVQETSGIVHKVMYPPNFKPSVVKSVVEEGEYTVTDVLIETESGYEVCMAHEWSIRIPRPVVKKLSFLEPLITGIRVIDTLFPVACGGTAIIPGGFGTGKTVTQQSLARWCSADVIVYIGCGERGNEMTEVLEEFPQLKDPRTGASLMERTILIANTSNMPVAAREASIYLGITIAEYYRDMGYHVALMADSTSRWAEALREISGRLEEMPGEEGYPAYLASRLASYYERSGLCECLGSPKRVGSITVISAVSPPGGDFSEPVTQASLRLGGAFWALDKSLAQRRHFPSINWNTSYSLYIDRLENWFEQELGSDWKQLISFVKEILSKEKSLMEMIQLVGRDALSEEDLLSLDVAKLIRTQYLQQNAFDPVDAYTPLQRQKQYLKMIKEYYDKAKEAIKRGVLFSDIEALGAGVIFSELKSMPLGEYVCEHMQKAWDNLLERIQKLEVQ